MTARTLGLILAFTLWTASSFGQRTDLGQITGVVKDPSQAVVSGSAVILTNQQNKAKISTTTDSQGSYSFRFLSPGAYEVELEVKGFKATASPELQVTAGQTVIYDFSLALEGT